MDIPKRKQKKFHKKPKRKTKREVFLKKSNEVRAMVKEAEPKEPTLFGEE